MTQRYGAAVLRLSTLFVRTLRDDPTDAEVPSHRLLVRAGYIRRAAPGGFTWLPLGWKVYRNVERVIREEMDRAGFQEVHFPALLPREPFEVSGRWTEYGDGLFRLVDRRGADYLMAPTHEELFTLLVKDLYSSYKDLPLWIYQIQTKFRDEPRPRAGLLRGREFVMKDSYSFDVDDAGLDASYQRHREAYIRTFDRLGLPYVIVSAMSGAMGGSHSEEFLAPLDVGEDEFARCERCDYAANTEAVDTPAPDPVSFDDVPPPRLLDTPDTPTIATLVGMLNARDDLRRSDRPWTASDTLKNVVMTVQHPDGSAAPLAIGIPGDRELDLKRLQARLHPGEPRPFTDEDFAAHPALAKGYIGPGALGERHGIRYLVDPRVVPGTRWATGAGETGHHVVDLVAGRDFSGDGTIDATVVSDGDPCPRCGGALRLARGVEIGHIFQLGRRFSEAFGLTVLDADGKQATVTMGSYGIGVSRCVAAIAEATLDDLGLCWPAEVAPADVHVVIAGKLGSEQFDAGERLAAELEQAGVRVVLDDRAGISTGVKFADAELLGVPTIVVVGRALAGGAVELRDRRSGTRSDVALDDVLAQVS